MSLKKRLWILSSSLAIAVALLLYAAVDGYWDFAFLMVGQIAGAVLAIAYWVSHPSTVRSDVPGMTFAVCIALGVLGLAIADGAWVLEVLAGALLAANIGYIVYLLVRRHQRATA